MNIKPTGKSILVEPINHQTETVRGLHIPEMHRDQQPSIDCIVLGKGPKATEDVKVGDRVLIERFSGTDIESGRRKFKLIPSTQVLAIIE